MRAVGSRGRLGLACALATVAVLALVPSPAGATSSCAKAILDDWLDNGRVDRVYPLHCYGEAIDAIPADIRPYSNAEDAIRQALLAAGGRLPAAHQTRHRGAEDVEAAGSLSSSSSPSAVPIPLLVLGGMSLALLAAGGAGYVSRRRRAGDGDQP
jgi:hypothetical protein